MTYDVSPRREITRRRRPKTAAAFTLIEILVVVGILVIIVGIALPALNVARRSAKRTQISSQLAMIETAITSYTQDFKGRPPPVVYEHSAGGETSITVHEGYGVLGAVLVGPGGATTQPASTAKPSPSAPPHVGTREYLAGDVVSTATGGEFIAQQRVPPGTPAPSGARTEYWRPFGGVGNFLDKIYTDGANGPGVMAEGKKWGPYIQPDKLKMRGSAILDVEDNPIAYVPARLAKNNVRVPLDGPNGTRGSYVAENGSGMAQFEPQYNTFPNYALFIRTADNPPAKEQILNTTHRQNATKRMQLLMGAVPQGSASKPGCLDPKKEPIDVPYLLWSAGLDGRYGPDLDSDPVKQQRNIDKCDDLTNFKR